MKLPKSPRLLKISLLFSVLIFIIVLSSNFHFAARVGASFLGPDRGGYNSELITIGPGYLSYLTQGVGTRFQSESDNVVVDFSSVSWDSIRTQDAYIFWTGLSGPGQRSGTMSKITVRCSTNEGSYEETLTGVQAGLHQLWPQDPPFNRIYFHAYYANLGQFFINALASGWSTDQFDQYTFKFLDIPSSYIPPTLLELEGVGILMPYEDNTLPYASIYLRPWGQFFYRTYSNVPTFDLSDKTIPDGWDVKPFFLLGAVSGTSPLPNSLYWQYGSGTIPDYEDDIIDNGATLIVPYPPQLAMARSRDGEKWDHIEQTEIETPSSFAIPQDSNWVAFQWESLEGTLFTEAVHWAAVGILVPEQEPAASPWFQILSGDLSAGSQIIDPIPSIAQPYALIDGSRGQHGAAFSTLDFDFGAGQAGADPNNWQVANYASGNQYSSNINYLTELIAQRHYVEGITPVLTIAQPTAGQFINLISTNEPLAVINPGPGTTVTLNATGNDLADLSPAQENLIIFIGNPLNPLAPGNEVNLTINGDFDIDEPYNSLITFIVTGRLTIGTNADTQNNNDQTIRGFFVVNGDGQTNQDSPKLRLNGGLVSASAITLNRNLDISGDDNPLYTNDNEPAEVFELDPAIYLLFALQSGEPEVIWQEIAID